MLDLFEALADLFQGKCKAHGLEIFDGKDNYSRTFEKWCRKLYEQGITKQDMRRGIQHLEEASRDAARTDCQLWPPSYSAFIEHCQKQKERKFWAGLPKPTMSNEAKKEKMKELRGEFKL